MTLFRKLISTGLAADLTKNEAKVFEALMMQTLGYCKKSDYLSNKQLGDLTGIRADRLPGAIAGVLKKGLFEARRSTRQQFRYQIAGKIIQNHEDIFAPSLSQNGNNPQLTESLSEAQINNLKHSATLTSLNQANKTPRQQITEKSPHGQLDGNYSNSAVMGGNIEKSKLPLQTIKLPPNIRKEDYSRCLKALKGLNITQQQRVLTVFEINKTMDKILSPVDLFIALAQKEKDGCLIIPKKPKKIRQSPQRLFAKQEEKRKEKIRKGNSDLGEQFDRLTDLKNRALANKKTMPELAEEAALTNCLEDKKYLKFWLRTTARVDNIMTEELIETLGLEFLV